MDVQQHPAFTQADLKLYVYGSRQTDQFWMQNDNSHSKRPICLTDIEQFTFNNQDQNKQPIRNLLFHQPVYKIACGSLHSIVLLTDGRVFTFGCNDEGALGRRDTQCIPLQVKLEDPIDLIAAGDNHSLFANSFNGAVYFTGNYNFRSGEKMTQSTYDPIRIYAHEINSNNKGKRIQKLSCGANHSCILINDRIYCRGEPDASVIGRRISKRHKVENSLTFNGVNLKNVIDMQCGGCHTVAIVQRNQRKVYYAWGTNSHGQLGIGSFDNQPFPVQIKRLREKNVVKIAAGGAFTLFLTQEGQMYGCGNNEDSNLGLGEDFQMPESQNQQQQEDDKVQQSARQKQPQINTNANFNVSVNTNLNTNGNTNVNGNVNGNGNVDTNVNGNIKSDQMSNQINQKIQIDHPIMQPQQIKLPQQKSSDHLKQLNQQIKAVQLTQPKVQEPQLRQQQKINKAYIKSVVKIPLPQNVNNIAAGQNFGFAWNPTSLYSWGMGYGYVLLTGDEGDEQKPWKVKSKIINEHSIFELSAGNQHVLYTSYPSNIDRNSVKMQPKQSVYENLSIIKNGLKRRK